MASTVYETEISVDVGCFYPFCPLTPNGMYTVFVADKQSEFGLKYRKNGNLWRFSSIRINTGSWRALWILTPCFFDFWWVYCFLYWFWICSIKQRYSLHFKSKRLKIKLKPVSDLDPKIRPTFRSLHDNSSVKFHYKVLGTQFQSGVTRQ